MVQSMTDEEAAIFKKARTPFLILDYWNHDMSFNGVFINNADAARMAGEYLIKRGYKMSRLNVQKILYKNVQLICLF